MEWKWSIGEKYERSLRPIKNDKNEEQFKQNNLNNENQVVNQCLYSEDEAYDYDFVKQGQQGQQNQLINEFQKQPNKREDTYNRMAEREMVGQRGMNPFFPQGNNYLEDLMNQDNFLKPISTSMEKEK